MFNNKRYLFILIGVVAGAIAGYAYYFFVGCVTGTCAITSNPWRSTLYGMLMGGLMLDLVRDVLLKRAENQKKE
jgi:hypothetical protein